MRRVFSKLLLESGFLIPTKPDSERPVLLETKQMEVRMSAAEDISKSNMSDAEWQTRVDLAMLYRVLSKYRMTDLIYTHLTARVPGEPDTFLINPYGQMFDEITASSLVKLDMDGNVVGPEGEFIFAGYCIHSAVYIARPDAMVVTHTHTRATVAVSAMECGLLPLSQHSLSPLFSLAYHDYEGPANDLAERESLAAHLGDKMNMILKNHGTLCVGRTIPECFELTYYLDTSCQIQVDVMASGQVSEIPPEIVAEGHRQYKKRFDTGQKGQRTWEALRRQLDREGADYAT
ncbi:MAG: ribulose-5-phosphate 4-epimerase/fuculose-1-phosphate aldolase [Alphaproteobacteria bacterium]|jgi:ribulose-5-phosphate 4-epimerase/fuculose-1-phosphate aldolase